MSMFSFFKDASSVAMQKKAAQQEAEEGIKILCPEGGLPTDDPKKVLEDAFNCFKEYTFRNRLGV